VRTRAALRALVSCLTALGATAVLAPPAAPTLRRAGVVVPGKRFGGLELGATRADVRAAWGSRFGSCRGCDSQTWYYNFRPFEPEGVAVSFRRGRAVAFFTLWAPPGWRTDRGLRIGDGATRLFTTYRVLVRVPCGTSPYFVYTSRTNGATTAFYVRSEKIWAFGLSHPDVSPCR
jgi:hypothetical protein